MLPSGFTWSTGRVTDVPGVYCARRGAEYLYIGSTSRLRTRINQHKSTPWYRFALLSGPIQWSFHQTGHTSGFHWRGRALADAQALEHKLIKLFHPILNGPARGHHRR